MLRSRSLLAAVLVAVPVVAGVPALNHFVLSTTLEPLVDTSTCAEPCVKPAMLTLDTAPWTKVVIDGKTVGTTPLFRVRLTPGAHVAKFINEEAGIEHEAAFEVAGGYLTKVKGAMATAQSAAPSFMAQRRPSEEPTDAPDMADLVTPAFLTVDCTPWAYVFIDGRPAGTTPLFKKPIAPGAHVVELKNDAVGLARSAVVSPSVSEHVRLKVEPSDADAWRLVATVEGEVP